jgi:hypothetical protein
MWNADCRLVDVMGVEQPGLVLLSAAFALLGLYLLTKPPVIWRATHLFPFVFPLMMCLLWLDQVLKGIREGFDIPAIVGLTIIAIAPAILWAREYFGPSESWSIYNASRAQVIAALERALRNHAIPFDWRVNRLRLPTVGIGGSAVLVHGWFGGRCLEVIAADREERRTVTQTLLPLLREELSTLPRPIVPWSGVFLLAEAALLLVVATQPPKLFS